MRYVVLCVLIVWLFGCEKPTAPNQVTSNQPAPVSSPPPPPPTPVVLDPNAVTSMPAKRPVRMEVGCCLNDEEFQAEEIENPTAALIESKIRSLPWNDSRYFCSVSLTEKFEDPDTWRILDTLIIRGSLNAVNSSDKVHGQLNQNSGKTFTIFVSKKIKSVDQIAALCVSYFHNDGKHKTLTKWEDTSDQTHPSMNIYLTTLDGNTKDEEIDELDPKIIESKIRSIDWNTPNDSPLVFLGYSLVDYMQIRRSPESNAKELVLIVQWSEMNQKRTNKEFKAKSIDQLIPLLISYFKKDGQYKTMVEWKSEPE